MKATAYLLKNFKSLQESEKLSLPKSVPPEFIESDFYFQLSQVAYAFVLEENGTKKIKVFLSGQNIILKHEPEVWKKLSQYLEKA